MYKANPTGSKPFEIEMSDTDLENGEAIRLWLEATQWKFPAVNGCLLDKALQIINLARKYDCAPMRAAMMRLVYEAIAKKSIAIDKLVIFGAIVDEPELVAEVMRKQGIDQTTVFKSASKVTVKHIAPQKKRKLDDSSDVDLLENIKHISTPSEIPANYPKLYSSLDKKVSIATPQGGTDPTSWCMDDWRRVPYDYLWALSQVSLREFTTSNRAQRFLDIMRIIRSEYYYMSDGVYHKQ